jgi:hypothetical protein
MPKSKNKNKNEAPAQAQINNNGDISNCTVAQGNNTVILSAPSESALNSRLDELLRQSVERVISPLEKNYTTEGGTKE